ncbi:MAG: hypothetical protein HS126_37395 [Anaerolineales bacterium]|nr:hypothetical protein [Anaerolineales bacterium]
MDNHSTKPIDHNDDGGEVVQQVSEDFAARLNEEIDAAGGEWQDDEEFEGAIGRIDVRYPNQ